MRVASEQMQVDPDSFKSGDAHDVQSVFDPPVHETHDGSQGRHFFVMGSGQVLPEQTGMHTLLTIP